MTRIAINNGYLIDPKNKISELINLSIENGRIKALSKSPFKGEVTIDARGKIICPGFVDIHIHEDSFIKEENRFENHVFNSLLKMGVTTAVGGNCGIGPENLEEYIKKVDDLGTAINLGLLLPHEVLRGRIGKNNPYEGLTKAEILEMEEVGNSLMELGFLGISLGIRYTPGINKEELVAVSRIVAKNQGLLGAHVRNDAAYVIESLEEVIELAEISSIPVLISHLASMAAYGEMDRSLDLIDSKIKEGLNIYADSYPYTAFSTEIGSTTYDPGFLERYGIDYSAIKIASGGYAGADCSQELYKLLRREEPETLTIANLMKADEVELAISHPRVAIASDGILEGGMGHPRVAGSFPRLIDKYVRKKKVLSLEEAIEKSTYLPAKIMNIDRGSLSVGDWADLLIFDYEKIRDRADFSNPLREPEGIDYVIIAGEIALESNEIRRGSMGRFIRR